MTGLWRCYDKTDQIQPGDSQEGNVNLLKEIKRVVSCKSEYDCLPDSVDGVSGHHEVANKFKEVYETLYNCSDSSEEMKSIDEHIKHLIQGQNSSEAVEKMSETVVLDVIHSLKKHKMDVSNSFNSDSLWNAPDILSLVLSKVFKCWLYHGTITRSIWVCAFIPLLKSSLKDPASTDSYRAIAGSSLILKVFEKCILKVWGENLGSDSLQFGFKKHCSTTTASWLVQEVVQHYL